MSMSRPAEKQRHADAIEAIPGLIHLPSIKNTSEYEKIYRVMGKPISRE